MPAKCDRYASHIPIHPIPFHMSHTRPKQYFAAAHRAVAYGGAIEWTELPSFFTSASQHLATGGSRPVSAATPRSTLTFDDTAPAVLDAYPAGRTPAGHRIATDS